MDHKGKGAVVVMRERSRRCQGRSVLPQVDRPRSSVARADGAATAARAARATCRRSASPIRRSRTRRAPTRRCSTAERRPQPTAQRPEVRELAGFQRPILHGLCTYGLTGRALFHTACGSTRRDSRRSRAGSRARVPGRGPDHCCMWVDGDGSSIFRTLGDDGRVVLDARPPHLPLISRGRCGPLVTASGLTGGAGRGGPARCRPRALRNGMPGWSR